jgi:5-methylcytosine-specific restriction endonuclease McrA
MKFLLFLLLALPAIATAATDARICGEPQRTADGRIQRSKAVLRAYQKIHPCPSTGRTTGKCPGWALDHVIPLACGGCDRIENLQWLKLSIKSCAGTRCKDRWERAINCVPLDLPQ